MEFKSAYKRNGNKNKIMINSIQPKAPLNVEYLLKPMPNLYLQGSLLQQRTNSKFSVIVDFKFERKIFKAVSAPIIICVHRQIHNSNFKLNISRAILNKHASKLKLFKC